MKIADVNDGVSTENLIAFEKEINNLKATGGGDSRERQLDALMATLDLEDSDGVKVMESGSEIVVLTDAPSHNAALKMNVTDKAQKKHVCINFFLSTCPETLDCPWEDWEDYEMIANETGGIVVYSILDGSFDTFQERHDSKPCAEFHKRRIRRQVLASSYDIEQRCHYFNTSLFTTTVIVSGHTTQDSIIVTKPNTNVVRVTSAYRFDKIYRDPDPPSGQWSVCVNTGSLTITLDNTENMNIIPKYRRPRVNSMGSLFKYTPPPACKL